MRNPMARRSPMKTDLYQRVTNLIKASHSAGMKPAAIARMFRLSQSVVNRVLDLPAKSKR
jgi:DNA invertase Pin-like site-specific DNA recombinase